MVSGTRDIPSAEASYPNVYLRELRHDHVPMLLSLVAYTYYNGQSSREVLHTLNVPGRRSSVFTRKTFVPPRPGCRCYPTCRVVSSPKARLGFRSYVNGRPDFSKQLLKLSSAKVTRGTGCL